jgi:hypothetical protein
MAIVPAVQEAEAKGPLDPRSFRSACLLGNIEITCSQKKKKKNLCSLHTYYTKTMNIA